MTAYAVFEMLRMRSMTAFLACEKPGKLQITMSAVLARLRMFAEQEMLRMSHITASRALQKLRTNVSKSRNFASWKSMHAANNSHIVKQAHRKTPAIQIHQRGAGRYMCSDLRPCFAMGGCAPPQPPR